MKLPIPVPLQPMLAKRVDGLPKGGDWLFEPKWDGFRVVVFRDGDVDDLTRCLAAALSPERRAEWEQNIPPVIDRAHPRHLVAAIKRAAQG